MKFYKCSYLFETYEHRVTDDVHVSLSLLIVLGEIVRCPIQGRFPGILKGFFKL